MPANRNTPTRGAVAGSGVCAIVSVTSPALFSPEMDVVVWNAPAEAAPESVVGAVGTGPAVPNSALKIAVGALLTLSFAEQSPRVASTVPKLKQKPVLLNGPTAS